MTLGLGEAREFEREERPAGCIHTSLLGKSRRCLCDVWLWKASFLSQFCLSITRGCPWVQIFEGLCTCYC